METLTSKHRWWNPPREKQWYEIVSGNRVIGIMEDCAATQKEIVRLKNLRGMEIRRACDSSFLQFHAKTVLPLRIRMKMAQMAEVKWWENLWRMSK